MISETTCQEPTGGCGDNYYWDSYECICRQSTNTCDPQYCGVNHYWDSASCTCKCASYVACPTNYYWDINSCSCLSSTSANATATPTPTTITTTTDGSSCDPQYCGLNRYWDSASCTCKCASYTACPTNYYWDTASCSCLASSETSTKTTTVTTSCTAPATGCPVNYYWDNTTCSCIYSQTNIDRLAYEPTEITSCVRSKLTDYEYQKFRYFIPINQTGFDEIRRFHDKAAECWKEKAGVTATSETKTALFEKEQCLIKSIGEHAYRQIYEGRRIPTHTEHLWFERCYGKIRINSVQILTKDENLTTETISCLKNTFGDDLYQKINTQKIDVPPEMKNKVASCFGAKSQPFEEGLLFKIPETVKDCLNNSLGENKINKIKSGVIQASQEEKEKARLCFSGLNQQQIKFLPPPPEQIPFIDEAENIQLANIQQKEKTIKNKIYGAEVVFLGKALPETGIYIYIFSDPIVVVSKTDENGDWVYEMQKPLSEGKHVAYALSKSENGAYVRSSVFNFEVLAAEDETTLQVFLDEGKLNDTHKKFIYLSLTLILTTIVMVIGVIYFIRTNKKIKAGQDSTSDGNSKTEPGSGPIN